MRAFSFLWLVLLGGLFGALLTGAAGPKGTIHGQVQLLTQNHQTLGNPSQVVVYLKEVDGNKGFPPSKDKPSMASKDMKFEPEVLPILVGTTVSFPNWDDVLHNAYSISKTKKFDLGRYAYGESNDVHFTETGILNVYCKNHPKMTGYIVVLGNPYFTLTDKKGNFTLKNVPPGKYTIVSWFPYGDPVEKAVTLGPGMDITVDLSLVKVRNENPRNGTMAEEQKTGKTGTTSRKK